MTVQSTRRRFSLLAIGSELLDGRVLDTNSQFVAEQLESAGHRLAHVLSCDDSISEIVNCLQFLSRTADTIVISGGLGPTTDDLTREAVATLTNDQLKTRDEVVEQLRLLYEKRRRALDPSNLKQALFPTRAKVLANPIGTAPGFETEYRADSQGVTIVALPGVPREFRQMFLEHVRSNLVEGSIKPTRFHHIFKIFGLPEANVNTRLQPLAPPNAVTVSYRARFPEIHVVIKADTVCSGFQTYVAEVRKAIGEEFVFTEDAEVGFWLSLHRELVKRQVKIAVAESCTGGMIAAALTQAPGASEFFLGGVSCYSNQVKRTLLNVTDEALTREGAVSARVARQLAQSVHEKMQADLALSVTGIAGPDGGSAEKPVGTFFVGLASKASSRAFQYYFNSSRDMIREYAAYTAGDLLRRELLGLPTKESCP